MPISAWSTTPGNNNSAAPNGAPEGWAPSAVNDTIRQQMADHKTQWLLGQWFNHGDTVSRASATTFKIATDVTARYMVDRRLMCYDTSTLYGRITASSYSAPDTTVTVALDSGSLSSSLSSVALAILTPTNRSIPLYNFDTITASGAAQFQGTVTASGAAVFKTTATVEGAATISGAAVFKTTASVEGAATISGAATFKTTISVAGEATISGTATLKTVITGGAIADQAAMEAGTAVNLIVTPGRVQYHPAAVKSRCSFSYTTGTPGLLSNYNVASLTDTGTGVVGINFTTNMSSTSYTALANQANDGSPLTHNTGTAVSGYQILLRNTSWVATDSGGQVSTAAFGDQ